MATYPFPDMVHTNPFPVRSDGSIAYRSSLEAAAYHEAGHAVVAVQNGMRAVIVLVDEGNGPNGCCGYFPRFVRRWSSKTRLSRQIAIAFAGWIAERRSRGLPTTVRAYAESFHAATQNDGYSVPGLADLACALRLACEVAGSEDAAYKLATNIFHRTEQILSRKDTWSLVTAVAAALLEKPTEPLRGSQIDKIIRDAMNRSDAQAAGQSAVEPTIRS